MGRDKHFCLMNVWLMLIQLSSEVLRVLGKSFSKIFRMDVLNRSITVIVFLI